MAFLAVDAPVGANARTTADAPVTGGVLNVRGTSDTDYLDPNITYYSLGYSYVREFSRQLYTFPAVAGKTTTTVPDLATAMPVVSADGKTYRITIKVGAQWNTTPARQVTAADVVRGVKTTCNPVQPFGGLPDYESLIAGMRTFCNGFAKVSPSAAAIRAYTATHSLPGVKADASDPLTVVFTLTHRAGYFTDMLTLPAFSPRPAEMLKYVPASPQEEQHTISDGPYQVTTYDPQYRIVYTPNPAWVASTDTVRGGYVDKIIVTMIDDPETAQRRMEAGNPSDDLFMGGVPLADVPVLKAHHDPNLSIKPEIASNPYLVFNTRSPNSGGAMRRVLVRRAISYALDRARIIGALGGKTLSPPLTHVVPKQLHGSKNFNRYPHNTSNAKSLLKKAKVTNPTLKVLYRPSSPSLTSIFRLVRKQLKAVGVTVKGVPSQNADYYPMYLQNPNATRHGRWDIAIVGWGPDWYGDAALSFFAPLFDGRLAPPATSNFGLFNDPAVNKLIDQASTASRPQSDKLWAKADHKVMDDAPFFPISDPNEATYHAAQVHGFVYMPAFQTGDFTNVWLDPGKSGG